MRVSIVESFFAWAECYSTAAHCRRRNVRSLKNAAKHQFLEDDVFKIQIPTAQNTHFSEEISQKRLFCAAGISNFS
jgi:hypothetical protein